jgi:hypothetical protein
MGWEKDAMRWEMKSCFSGRLYDSCIGVSRRRFSLKSGFRFFALFHRPFPAPSISMIIECGTIAVEGDFYPDFRFSGIP